VALIGNREAHELLMIEEADAWFEYLEATRGQSLRRYGEVEPWAWARLSQRAVGGWRRSARPRRHARIRCYSGERPMPRLFPYLRDARPFEAGLARPPKENRFATTLVPPQAEGGVGAHRGRRSRT
jgi:hypothetical protein